MTTSPSEPTPAEPEVELVPFERQWRPAVERLNRRLRDGGFTGSIYPTEPTPFPDGAVEVGLRREYFVGVEGDEARGGYLLKSQDFVVEGQRGAVGTFQIPVAEGVIDKRYALLGPQLLFDATFRQPRLYALGIGGMEESLSRMLRSAGWSLHPVPFAFRVLRPSRFLRQIRYLRSSLARRIALDVMAFSGVVPLALRAFHAARDRHRRRWRSNEWQAGVSKDFGPWADEIWQRSQDAYSLIAVRDAASLEVLYPTTDERFVRLRVRTTIEGTGTDVGWAVVMNNAWDDHRQFGKIRLGSIVDTLALPGYEAAVTSAATRYLQQDGADLIVCNQNHQAWVEALTECGFLLGPSNFIFAASPALTSSFDSYDDVRARLHLNRGDGDGPIHL